MIRSQSIMVIFSVVICWINAHSALKSNSASLYFDVNNDGISEACLDTTGLAIGVGVLPSANLTIKGNSIVSGTLTVGSATKGSSNLNIEGSYGFSRELVSSNTLLSENSFVLVDTSGNNVFLTLPYAGNVEGRTYYIKKISENNFVKLSSVGSLIDNSSYYNFSSGNLGSLRVISKSGNWYILSGGGVSGAWTPSNISTTLWEDAADSSTITAGSSGNISEWRDKSGNGYHLMNSGGNQAFFNRDRITFSGAGNYLKTSTTLPFGSGNAYTLITVSAWSQPQVFDVLGLVAGYGYGTTDPGSIMVRADFARYSGYYIE